MAFKHILFLNTLLFVATILTTLLCAIGNITYSGLCRVCAEVGHNYVVRTIFLLTRELSTPLSKQLKIGKSTSHHAHTCTVYVTWVHKQRKVFRARKQKKASMMWNIMFWQNVGKDRICDLSGSLDKQWVENLGSQCTSRYKDKTDPGSMRIYDLIWSWIQILGIGT